MFPRGGAAPPSGLDARRARVALDGYLAIVPPRMRRLVRLLFFAAASTRRCSSPRRGRAAAGASRRSTPEQRAAVLEGWRTSRSFPRRLVFTSLRAIVTQGYFADAGVLRALGLAPFAIETPVDDGRPALPADRAAEARDPLHARR